MPTVYIREPKINSRCESCSQPITGTRAKRFCSDKCRKSYRRRVQKPTPVAD